MTVCASSEEGARGYVDVCQARLLFSPEQQLNGRPLLQLLFGHTDSLY